MKKLVITVQVMALIVATLLVNTLLLTFILYVNSTLLVHDKMLTEQHHTMLSVLLFNTQESLTSFLTPEEASHINDVARIFHMLPAILMLSIAALYICHKKHRDYARLAIYATIALVMCVPILALTFTNYFILFHELLFPQGNWSFSQDSTLIRLYPETFWQTAALLIILGALVQLVVIGGLHKMFSKHRVVVNNNSL